MKGIKGAVVTGVWLLILAGGVIAWANVNSIKSPIEFYDYFKSWSDKTSECYGTDEDIWNCEGGGLEPSDGPANGGTPTEVPEKEYNALVAQLKGIPTKPLDNSNAYNRADWKHWSDLDKNGCDARDDVLISQAKAIKFEAGDKCEAESGEWISPYDTVKFTDPSKMDIDHVIPLGYASKHGGSGWSASKKEAFANDFSQLLATSASENRKKSDRGPGSYMPPEKTYWCSYAQIWIKTAGKYGIWLEKEDKAVLETALGTC